MEITQINVYNFEQAIAASRLPMISEYSDKGFDYIAEAVGRFRHYSRSEDTKHMQLWDDGKQYFERAAQLAQNPPGTGHNNFLKGIRVVANVTATVKWWVQAGRYNFIDHVSSMSTMHCLKKMLTRGETHFHPSTHQSVIDAFKKLDPQYLPIEQLAYSCPMGLLLTEQISTNYLQLKTVYQQRRNHVLTEWRQFCLFIEALPHAAAFIIKQDNEE